MEGNLRMPLPNEGLQDQFRFEFGVALEELWDDAGMNVTRFIHEILGVEMEEEEVLAYLRETYGYSAYQVVRHISEYMLFQAMYRLSNRLN